jgi:hypothetical protein
VSDFGDIEPEDAWDPGDPIPELLGNLARRVVLLLALEALSERAHVRLSDLADDLEHVRRRVEAGP